MNKYDLNHRVWHHGRMSDREWEAAYRAAWDAYYTPEHIRTILRRKGANRPQFLRSVFSTILWFKLMIPYEGVHPLEGGLLRRKYRRDRRPGLPRENPLLFYPRYVADTLRKGLAYLTISWRAKKILDEVRNAPDRASYTDLAIAPASADEFESLDLYHQTSGGEDALARKRRDDAIRAKTLAAAHAPAAENDAA